jgi:hypothetical protein
MKTTFSAGVVLLVVACIPASAQVFQPRVRSGGADGRVSVPADHSAHRGADWRGGSAGFDHRGAGGERWDYVRRRGPEVTFNVWPGYTGYGYANGFYGGYGYANADYGGYGYGYYDGYGAGYPYYGSYGGYDGYGSNAASGLWLGALAGAIIGNNSGSLGHNAWRGAAWGAGAGWLLGTIADVNRRAIVSRAQPQVVALPPVQQGSGPAPVVVVPQSAGVMTNVSPPAASPMREANALFGRN